MTRRSFQYSVIVSTALSIFIHHDHMQLTVAMMFAVDLPINPPTLPIANSNARVDAKPLLGANQEENILYCAICVAISPKARIILPPIMNLNDRTVAAAATSIDPMV